MDCESRDEQVAALRKNGLVVVRGLVDADRVASLRRIAQEHLDLREGPLELEADVGYPGAPTSQQAQGGRTVRRLLDAWSRHEAFRAWATSAPIQAWMQAYFDEPAMLSLAHHNCVMTKHPRYGSLTGWHRDFRYWSFAQDDMVSVWLALGPEHDLNGGLHLIPGSHTEQIGLDRFDPAKFLRADHPANQPLLAKAIAPTLQAGDVMFFHSNTLHAAGQNQSDTIKFSPVFTYHAASNHPTPGTRSAAKGSVALNPAQPGASPASELARPTALRRNGE